MLITQDVQYARANPESRVSEFTLSNGLVLVVVPDNRAPVITQMVYIRAGSADEPPGVSGIAHFLEHLMFKSTEKLAKTGQKLAESRPGRSVWASPDGRHRVVLTAVETGLDVECYRVELAGKRLSYTEEALARILSPRYFVDVRRTPGGPAPDETRRAAAASRALLDADETWWTHATDALAAAERTLAERSAAL